MILDQELTFSDAQALTATALSTNVIDLGPLSGLPSANTVRDLGAGDPMWLYIQVHTVLDSSGEGATLTITLESDSVSTIDSSATTHWTSGSIAEATLVAGYEIKLKLPPGAYEQYLALRYTVGVESFTSGKISAHLVRDVDLHRYYRGGSVSSAE